MLKKYFEYLRDNPNNYWFKRKLYGWGWTPVKWQGGWLVILVGVAILFAGVYVGEIDDAPGAAGLGLLIMIALIITFGYWKGEKPKWQWGKKKNLNMKLLLTSAGFANRKIGEAFVAEIGKPLEQKTILVIAYAQNDEEQFYINESIQELKDFGFKKITIYNLHMPTAVEELRKFDAIYVCGGNTYSILKKMRETGIDNFIITQIKAGAIYVGVSAGSIIAGPGIKIAGYGSEGDPNEVKLTDLNGFKLTDIIIFPHFREPLRSEVESFQKLVKNSVVALTNDQALLIVDGKSKLIE